MPKERTDIRKEDLIPNPEIVAWEVPSHLAPDKWSDEKKERKKIETEKNRLKKLQDHHWS